MDAVTYITNMRRMCKSQGDTCRGCKLSNEDEDPCYLNKTAPEYCVTVVEQWAKEHPIKTRQSVFLQQYPEAKLRRDGVLTICPLEISPAYREKDGSCASRFDTCAGCKRKFWLAEVEE